MAGKLQVRLAAYPGRRDQADTCADDLAAGRNGLAQAGRKSGEKTDDGGVENGDFAGLLRAHALENGGDKLC